MNKHEFVQRLGTWRDSLRSTERLPPPRLWPELLQHRDDTEVALAIVALDGQALAVLSERLRDDGECVRLAVQENACAFEHASHRLKGDKTFVHTLLHIPKSSWVYEYINDELKKDQELAQLAVSGCGWMIEFLPEPHRRDWQLIRLAVANEYQALSAVEPALRADKAFIYARNGSHQREVSGTRQHSSARRRYLGFGRRHARSEGFSVCWTQLEKHGGPAPAD